MIKLTFELSEHTTDELKPHYDRFNAIETAAGREPHTFEEYLEMVLTLGCHGFMIRNADRLESSLKAYYKQTGGDKIDE